jgi:hypothetical protein
MIKSILISSPSLDKEKEKLITKQNNDAQKIKNQERKKEKSSPVFKMMLSNTRKTVSTTYSLPISIY